MTKDLKRLLLVLLVALLTACVTKPISGVNSLVHDKSKLDLNIAALDQAEKFYRSADWTRARAAYEELSAEFPKNSFIWFRLGNVMAHQGQYDAAVSAYNRALAADSTNIMAAYNAGLIRLAQADAAFETVEARLSNRPELARQMKGLRQATREQLERAMLNNLAETTPVEKPTTEN